MSTSCCRDGSGLGFFIRHGFRQADYYNRLEPFSVIHLVRSKPGTRAVSADQGKDCDDRFTSASDSSGPHRLFVVPELQACDTLLPSQQLHRKGTG
jgi:hypothetical protein